MFAYCNNNPVLKFDPTGESALVTLLFAAAGATTNVISSYIGALVTGQDYTLTDGLVAAASGAFCAFGSAGAVAAGLVSGLYSAFMSYQSGADWRGVMLSGLASGIFTTAGIGNLAGLEQTLSNLGIQLLTDFVFCTGYNSMSAAVFKMATMDSPSQKYSLSNNTIDAHLYPENNVSVSTNQGSSISKHGLSLSSTVFMQCCYLD